MFKWKMMRVRDDVHARLSKLGNCGTSKSDVLLALIDFYEKHDKRKELFA